MKQIAELSLQRVLLPLNASGQLGPANGFALHGHTDGHLLLDAIEIERQRNRMMRQTMGFRHAVVDAHNGELVAVMRSPDDAYDYCDYFATARRDATVLDLWLRFKTSRLFQCVFWVYNCSLFRLCRSSLVHSLRSSYRL